MIRTRGSADINLGLATISRKYIEVKYLNNKERKDVTLDGKEFLMCEIGSQTYLVNEH